MPKKGKGERKLFRILLPIIPAALLVAFIVFLIITPPNPPTATVNTPASQGDVAPDFTLRVINGGGLTDQSFSLSQAKGKIIFMDFIFEWCPHCNNMAGIIDKLHQQYGDEVLFITVAGSSNTTPEKTAEYLKRHQVSWTSVYDDRLDVFRRFGVRGTPTYFVISSNGIIMGKLEGEQPYATLEQLIRTALGG
jgi:peroxiredoxin